MWKITNGRLAGIIIFASTYEEAYRIAQRKCNYAVTIEKMETKK